MIVSGRYLSVRYFYGIIYKQCKGIVKMQKFFRDDTGIPDVDLYILKHDAEKQRRLLAIRSAVLEKHRDATERVYYGIPTVEIGGKIILQYAAYKKHISLLVGNILPAIFKEKYPNYSYTDYTVVLPDKEAFPEDFVKEICGTLGQLTGEDFYAKSNNKK